jgi:hypothetical protein
MVREKESRAPGKEYLSSLRSTIEDSGKSVRRWLHYMDLTANGRDSSRRE